MIDFDAIRSEVAIRHNLLLGKDDPILAAVTVNELVLARYLDLVSEQYDEANRTLAVMLQQNVELSKDTAGKIITDAANYVSDQLRQTVAEVVKEAGKDLRRQVAEAQAASRETVANVKDAQTAKTSALIAAVLAGVAAVVAVGSLVVVLLK